VTETEVSNPGLRAYRSLHILIVEDYPDGRESLRTLLEAWGHQVEVAVDGRDGLQKGLAVRPELALIDIGLPYLDGYQVAEKLRAALGNRIFLVACTAYGRPEDRRRALAAGFDIHLVKPVDLDDLAHWLVVAAVTLPPGPPHD
jgi:CheY-like chemotaxis protein